MSSKPRSKRERHRGVREVDVLRRSRVLDERPVEEVAVPEVGAEVAVDLPAQEQVDLAADVGRVAAAAGPEGGTVGGEERIAIAFSPELVVLATHADLLSP